MEGSLCQVEGSMVQLELYVLRKPLRQLASWDEFSAAETVAYPFIT